MSDWTHRLDMRFSLRPAEHLDFEGVYPVVVRPYDPDVSTTATGPLTVRALLLTCTLLPVRVVRLTFEAQKARWEADVGVLLQPFVPVPVEEFELTLEPGDAFGARLWNPYASVSNGMVSFLVVPSEEPA